MKVRFRCQQCGQKYKLDLQRVGQTHRCAVCKFEETIPAPGERGATLAEADSTNEGMDAVGAALPREVVRSAIRERRKRFRRSQRARGKSPASPPAGKADSDSPLEVVELGEADVPSLPRGMAIKVNPAVLPDAMPKPSQPVTARPPIRNESLLALEAKGGSQSRRRSWQLAAAFVIVVAGVVALTAALAGSAGEDDPALVLRTSVEALQRQDHEALARTLFIASGARSDEDTSGSMRAAEVLKAWQLAINDHISVTVDDSVIKSKTSAESDLLTASLRVRGGHPSFGTYRGEIPLTLRKQSGAWKVDYGIGALFVFPQPKDYALTAALQERSQDPWQESSPDLVRAFAEAWMKRKTDTLARTICIWKPEDKRTLRERQLARASKAKELLSEFLSLRESQAAMTFKGVKPLASDSTREVMTMTLEVTSGTKAPATQEWLVEVHRFGAVWRVMIPQLKRLDAPAPHSDDTPSSRNPSTTPTTAPAQGG